MEPRRDPPLTEQSMSFMLTGSTETPLRIRARNQQPRLPSFLIGWLPQWGEAFTGYIDEVRMSNVARYPAADFEVPSSELSADADTMALYPL